MDLYVVCDFVDLRWISLTRIARVTILLVVLDDTLTFAAVAGYSAP